MARIFYSFVVLRESLHSDADEREVREVERDKQGRKKCGRNKGREEREKRVWDDCYGNGRCSCCFCLYVGRDAVTSRE